MDLTGMTVTWLQNRGMFEEDPARPLGRPEGSKSIQYDPLVGLAFRHVNLACRPG